MASSKSASIRKAQIPSLCHLCEDSPSIQWKCVDCDLLMCSKCKTKVHSKFKAADDHDVISLKDVSFTTGRKGKLNLQSIACKIHKGQKVCLYCHACRKMACPNCVTEEHKKHDLEDLRKVYDDRVCNLEYLCDEMKADLQFVDEEGDEIENKQSTHRNQNATTKQAIVSQKDTLIKLVESEAAKRLQKLENSSMQQDHAFSSTVADNLRFKEETKSKISTVEAALNNNDIDTIINADEVLIPSVLNRRMPNRDTKRSILKFGPGKIDQKQVSQMFGSLQHTKDESEIKLDILDSYQSDFGTITNLCSCKNGHILMFDEQEAKSMKSMQLKDNTIIPNKETNDIRVFDIIETEKNEFVVSFMENTALKRLGHNGKFEDFLDFSPLLPRALALTRSGHILVSVRDQGDIFPLLPTSQRKLLMVKADGKVIHEYNLDNKNKRLFSLVMRVKSGMNNGINLIDWTSHDEDGSVIALGYPNKMVWKYSGHESINAKFPFRPSDIVITEFGNIVVADRFRNIFHILNCDGSLKKAFTTEELGVYRPLSVTIDTTGLLWIGCTTKRGREHLCHIARRKIFWLLKKDSVMICY